MSMSVGLFKHEIIWPFYDVYLFMIFVKIKIKCTWKIYLKKFPNYDEDMFMHVFRLYGKCIIFCLKVTPHDINYYTGTS